MSENKFTAEEITEYVNHPNHYVYGSGMFGCLYDYGPNFCADKDDAIQSFVEIFSDSLSEEELAEMKDNLRQDGRHVFSNAGEAGAQYCELNEEVGEMPEMDD